VGPTHMIKMIGPITVFCLILCHTISMSVFVCNSAYFRLVCSEIIVSFLLIGDFDGLKFLAHMCKAPKV